MTQPTSQPQHPAFTTLPPQITRQDLEQALDNGHLWTLMVNGRYWLLRRTGRTKLWKRDPTRFELPVKAGLRSCDQITEYSHVTRGRGGQFVISTSDPNLGA